MTRVAVLGAGSWGTAMASLAARRNDVVLWAREPEVVEGINLRHRNPLFLSEFALPRSLGATSAIGGALDGAEVVVVAVHPGSTGP